QRLPEQHAAVLALVIQRAKAVEEDHEGQDDEGPGRPQHQAEVDAVGELRHVLRAHLLRELAQVEPADVDAVQFEMAGVGGAARGCQPDDDRQQGQHERDAAGNHRGPEEAALVLPELALEQQLELVGRVGRRGRARCGGQGVVEGVHAYVPFMVATNRSARPGVRVSPRPDSWSRGMLSNSITVLPKGRVRSSTGLRARAASALSALTMAAVKRSPRVSISVSSTILPSRMNITSVRMC